MAGAKMSAEKLSKRMISSPVLQSATNIRVSPTFRDGNIYSSTGEVLKTQLEQKPSDLQSSVTEIEGVQRLQTKYASPDNLQVQTTSTKIANTNVNRDTMLTNGSSSAFSDTSSDVSDITAPLPNTSSSLAYAPPEMDGITEENINQVDIFYRSHKTEVKVCRSLANLYISAPKTKSRTTATPSPQMSKKSAKDKSTRLSEGQQPPPPDPTDFAKDEWEFSKTGIPVLVLDTGEHIREKRLRIVLAEKGTGFTLWQDQFNHFTEYSTPHSNFHTVTLSTDSSRLIGLSFDEGKAAGEFAEAVRSFTSNPDDDLLNLSKKKKKEKSKQKYKPPKKADISQPVCFVHVTKLEKPSMFPPPPSGVELTRAGIPRAMSDSSGISECSTSPSEH